MFNLAAPTPVMNGVGRADGNETEQIEKATKLTEKEENNNKKNKRPLEEEKTEETRKKAATDGGPKPIFEVPPFGGSSEFSSVGGSPKSAGGSSKLEAAVTQTLTFRPPTTVITQVKQSLLVFDRLTWLLPIWVVCRHPWLQQVLNTTSPSPRPWWFSRR